MLWLSLAVEPHFLSTTVIIVNYDDAPLRLTRPADDDASDVTVPVVCVARSAGTEFPRRAPATLWLQATSIDPAASEAERAQFHSSRQDAAPPAAVWAPSRRRGSPVRRMSQGGSDVSGYSVGSLDNTQLSGAPLRAPARALAARAKAEAKGNTANGRTWRRSSGATVHSSGC